MPELRKDPLIGRWVIVSTERGKRPSEFTPTPVEQTDHNKDPFAEGNEHLTPAEIFAFRNPHSKPNGPGWQVRVVPNKFPALRIEGDLGKEGHGMPANQAGSMASFLSDGGISTFLTRADFATFNAATPNQFAQGVNGSYLVSDNVLGREVHFSFPHGLANAISLGEEPFRDFEMHLAFVTRSLEVGKLIIGKVSPSIGEGDLDMGAPALPITFRVLNDGQNCQLYRVVWFGQARACE
jgi:hypothetical protein